jgi:hypothetical protein
MFNSSEEQLVVEAQEIHEEHITIRFDVPRNEVASWIGVLILRQLIFNVVTIIGVSPNET